MLLHPDDALAQFRDDHEPSLAILHGCLDQGVAEAFGRWSDRDPVTMDQSVLAGCVRQSSVDLLGAHLPRAHGAIDRTLNCGIHLYLKAGWRTRVRKRPSSLRTGALITPTPPPEALFGEPHPWYEIAVLWALNFKERCLHSAMVAAVTSLDEPHLVTIYAELPLPPGELPPMTGEFEPVPEPEDDFDDFLGGGAASPPASA